MLRCAVVQRCDDWKQSLPVTGEQLATVRYHGDFPLEDWSSAWGVEWDSPSKGKNSGAYKGQQFFDCIQGRGSFLREGGAMVIVTEKEGLTLGEAWNLRYGSVEDEAALGDVQWASNVRKVALSEVNLAGYNVSSIGDTLQFTQVSKLNLGFNLFSVWGDELLQGLAQMQLNWLNLSGNRFLSVDCDSQPKLMLKTLILARCMFRYVPLWPNIVNTFYNVKRLDLGFNEFTCDDFESIEKLKTNQSVECLELNGNGFTTLCFEKAHWPSLRILEVSNCPIATLTLDLPFLETLDISNTLIGLTLEELEEWCQATSMPSLITIKLFTDTCIDSLDYTTNKLSLSPSIPPVHYDVVLGLLSTNFPKLSKINGTVYTETQLHEYRRFYAHTLAKRTAPLVQDSDLDFTTVIVKVPLNGILTEKSLRVKKGTPWYVVYGALAKNLGLTPGEFALEKITT